MVTRVGADRIRLLKFVTMFGVGGTERQVLNLGLGLDRSRFELRLACFRRTGHFLSEIEARHIPIETFGINRLYNCGALREQARFGRHVRREGIDIVHSYGFYGNVFAIPAARLARTPVVIASIRDTGVYLTLRQRKVQRAACRLADHILVNADAVRRWLVDDGYRPSKISVIQNGIDLSQFVGPRDGGRVRRQLGFPPDAPVAALVSRLSPSKGVEHFLEAAVTVSRQVPNAHFLIVGDGFAVKNGLVVEDAAYRSKLQEYAADLGLGDRVRFTGVRLDVPEILAETTVSVLPSFSEGLSNTLIESMAAGCPVVATRVGGNPEVVDDGVTGFLVPPADSAALAGAMCKVLENPELAHRFGRAGRRRAREQFSLERMVSRTEEFYVELLRERRSPHRWIPRRAEAEPHGSTAAATILSPTYRVEAVTDYADLAALGPAWTDLVERADLDHPFLSHDWVCAWWESFGAGNELHVLLAKTEDRLVGIAPLMLGRGRMYGFELRYLRSIGNDHTPRADFIVDPEHQGAYHALWSHLRRDTAAWDVLQLSQLPPGSTTLALLPQLAKRDGFLWGLWRSTDSPYVPIQNDRWDAYLKRLSGRHRRNLRNRLKRLSQIGDVSLLRVSSLDDSGREALAKGLRIEAAAWKGQAGTAIASRPELRQFYTRVAQRSAERDWLRLHFLTVAGRPIAFGYFLRYKQKLYLLKPGYDPEFAPYSPCNLLCYMVLREAFQSGLAECDFLGDDDDWKRQWTDERRQHYWLFVFPNHPRARLLHYVKFQLLPWLRQKHLYPLVRGSASGRASGRLPVGAEAWGSLP